MDTCTLVTEQIDAGERLLRQLRSDGFDVTAGFWLQASEEGAWRFCMVSPLVETEGLAQAYRRLHPVIWKMPQPFWIDPLEVRLIGPSNPIAQDVLAVQARLPSPLVSPIRWGGNRLGNLNVEGAYIYPLSARVSG